MSNLVDLSAKTGRRLTNTISYVSQQSHIWKQPTAGGKFLDGSFLAKITSGSTKYAWSAVDVNSSGVYFIPPNWDSGTTTKRWAIEINGESVPAGTIVKLRPTSQSFYCFDVSEAINGDSGGNGSVSFCCTTPVAPPQLAVITDCTGLNLMPEYELSYAPFGVNVILEFVGGCSYESDTVTWKNCEYHWELEVDRSPGASTLTLAFDSLSGGTGTGTGSCDSVHLEFTNINSFFDAIGLTTFTLTTDRQSLPSEIAEFVGCEVCVKGLWVDQQTPCMQAGGRTLPDPTALVATGKIQDLWALGSTLSHGPYPFDLDGVHYTYNQIAENDFTATLQQCVDNDGNPIARWAMNGYNGSWVSSVADPGPNGWIWNPDLPWMSIGTVPDGPYAGTELSIFLGCECHIFPFTANTAAWLGITCWIKGDPVPVPVGIRVSPSDSGLSEIDGNSNAVPPNTNFDHMNFVVGGLLGQGISGVQFDYWGTLLIHIDG